MHRNAWLTHESTSPVLLCRMSVFDLRYGDGAEEHDSDQESEEQEDKKVHLELLQMLNLGCFCDSQLASYELPEIRRALGQIVLSDKYR